MPSLTELAHLARHPDPDATNISRYLLDHYGALHDLVGLPKAEVKAMKDRELAPLVVRRLELHRSMLARQRQGVARERVERVAAMLQRGLPLAEGVQLDPSLFFRDLLADPSTPFIQMRLPGLDLLFCRLRLRKMAAVLCRKTDLVVWVDARGLHLRWNNGRGGLNLLPDRLRDKHDRVLTLDLQSCCSVDSADERAPSSDPLSPDSRTASAPPKKMAEERNKTVPFPPRSIPRRTVERKKTWVIDFLSFL